jgi:glucose-1-phosphate cytidylyltransferase
LEDSRVSRFKEKPDGDEGWINGGFFVLNRKVLDYIEGDDCIWERGPLERLAEEGQLMGYPHKGFWSCIDTLREKNIIEDYWNSGRAPWKIW